LGDRVFEKQDAIAIIKGESLAHFFSSRDPKILDRPMFML
jgi:hypothetical protein